MTSLSGTQPAATFSVGQAALASNRDLTSSVVAALAALRLEHRQHRILPRPTFVPRETVSAAAAATTSLIELMQSLVVRHFDGNTDRLLQARATPPAVANAIAAGSVGSQPMHARADVILVGGRPYIIEINIGSGLGGLYLGPYFAALAAVPAFAEFSAEHHLDYVDTSAVFVQQICRYAGAIVGTTAPVVAVVEETNSSLGADFIVDALRRLGITTHHGELGDISLREDKVHLAEHPIDVVVRYFYPEHMPAEPDGNDRLQLLARAHHAGRTALFTSMDLAPVDSKSALALLYEPTVFASLTAPERDLVTTFLPWTRLMGHRFYESDSVERAELVARCVRERTQLVLKPGSGFGAGGVYFGSDFTDVDWLDLLESAATEGYVVQQRARPDEELMFDPATGTTEAWHLNWGVFVTDVGYSGLLVRGRPASDDGAIGDPARTRIGLGFTYETE
ncbi:hypothetical protein [Streptomyces sp. NRRL S-1824]|uniref:hypothetical protein n=1 Tax=Streptomyces sp. NRRL S-1824 TaxID=1463889 RepID=UPI00068D47A7|nr:hypothetical protein [Streptomyces sp. NRRL S-1824]